MVVSPNYLRTFITFRNIGPLLLNPDKTPHTFHVFNTWDGFLLLLHFCFLLRFAPCLSWSWSPSFALNLHLYVLFSFFLHFPIFFLSISVKAELSPSVWLPRNLRKIKRISILFSWWFCHLKVKNATRLGGNNGREEVPSSSLPVAGITLK